MQHNSRCCVVLLRRKKSPVTKGSSQRWFSVMWAELVHSGPASAWPTICCSKRETLSHPPLNYSTHIPMCSQVSLRCSSGAPKIFSGVHWWYSGVPFPPLAAWWFLSYTGRKAIRAQKTSDSVVFDTAAHLRRCEEIEEKKKSMYPSSLNPEGKKWKLQCQTSEGGSGMGSSWETNSRCLLQSATARG